MTRPKGTIRVVAARFISRTGGEAAFFVGLWGKAAYDLRADVKQLALMMFVIGAAAILGGLVGGVLVDRYGPRTVLWVGELAFVPATLSLTLARDTRELIALAALWAFVWSPTSTAIASFAPFLTADERGLERVNADLGAAGSLALVVGPALGALIVALSSSDWVFYFDAATSVVAAALVIGVPLVTAVPDRVAGTSAVRELVDGLKATYSLRPVRYYVLAGTVVWFGFGAFGALEPLFFRDVLGEGVDAIGWVNAVFGVGLFAGAALLPRLPRSLVSARGLTATVILCGLGGALYVSVPRLAFVAAGGFVWAVFIGVFEPLARTLMHRDTPHALVGRVSGAAEVHRTLGELLPLTVAPALAAAIGVQGTMIAGGLAAASIAALAWREGAAVDRITAGRPRETTASFDAVRDPLTPGP